MSGNTVVVVPPHYTTGKGPLALSAAADELILYDDMQYTRRDWRNRNKIKTPAGPLWLTVPVEVKGKYSQTIRETRVADMGWPEVHWRTIQHNYARATYFRQYRGLLEDLFLGSK